jgi:hypothetical protein
MGRKATYTAVMFMLMIGAAGIGICLFKKAQVSAQEGDKSPLIILYWEENFEGRSLELRGTAVDLPTVSDEFDNKFSWSDEVRSLVVVQGTWRFYQHGRLNTKLDETKLEDFDLKGKERIPGWSMLVSATSKEPLKLSSPANGGFDHDISSIALVSSENLPDWAAP